MELGLAHATAHADVLDGLKEEINADDLGGFFAKPVDHLLGADGALAFGFERDEHAAVVHGGVSGCRADEGAEAFHGRVGQHDGGDFLLQPGHGLKRNILRRFGGAHQTASILLREESLGHDGVEPDGGHHGEDGDAENEIMMLQHPLQAGLIMAEQPLVAAFAGAVEWTGRAGIRLGA